ncbi:hypothetical protein FBU59_001032 [Linderina macrospora]|uniref:Uncharacterized protein n=1 Tax=Linderina macrospora TaxID=4868 RepID=A0ACC1JFG0_9FUNG|nr:hypothetical protein FBU59_001032 [Linderina macrospora]
MTDTQVQIEANIALLAGANTSSNTLKWTIRLLMLHPEIYVIFSALGMDVNTWKEPLKFDLSRFVNSEEARHNFFGFSHVVCICPGRHIA